MRNTKNNTFDRKFERIENARVMNYKEPKAM